jgi:hypothetical protein
LVLLLDTDLDFRKGTGDKRRKVREMERGGGELLLLSVSLSKIISRTLFSSLTFGSPLVKVQVGSCFGQRLISSEQLYILK